jgi:hypothetical protein
MKMEQVNEKYERVLKFLKQAKPVLDSTDQIEEKVMESISRDRNQGRDLSEFIDFIFGWTYIAWVRRSLITASAFLVLVFVFQQSLIMNQINNLSRQIDTYEKDASGVSSENLNRRMLMYRLSDKRFPLVKKSESEKQLEKLFRSIDEFEKEYNDLHNMIEQDPELKKLIEKKLSEITESKIKL